MDRLAFLAEHVDLASASALEIGALDRPILAAGAADVRYLDHLGTVGLRAKYRDDPAVRVDRIVPVDYICDNGIVSAAVTDGRRFDVVVASHVFEHIPDPIGWLLDVGELLRDGGCIFLVLPDRRFTFDARRADTAFSQWIGWHLRQLRRPAPDQVFDHFARVCTVPPERAWRGAGLEEFPSMYGTQVAYDLAREVATEDRYVDVHCSVFTPCRFVSLCAELAGLNLFPFRFAAFQPTQPESIEFFALLQAARDESMPLVDQDTQRTLARRAGYQGEFGGGLFRQAQDADPALKARYEALMEDARAEAARVWEARPASRFPDLDPALHHDRPRPGDPRIGDPRIG